MSMLMHKIVKCEYLQDSEEDHENKAKMRVCLNALVSLLVGIYAFYISYSSNSGVAMPLRIVYAIFAFLFGMFYLFYYFFVVFLAKAFPSRK